MTELIEEVTITDLTQALDVIVGKGLPVSDDLAGEVLPNLKSVYARAVVPSDRQSRISSLNQLLPRLIAAISDGEFRESTQALFGLAPGTMHASLTERIRRASAARGYSAAHFRDVIKAQTLESIAHLIYDDLLRYRSRIKRSPESLEPTGDTPTLGPEHISHQEELISRIWQHVYGLRAELIAFARFSGAEGYEVQAEDHRQAAIQEEAHLRNTLDEFTRTYGESLVRHGATEFSREAVERLSEWNL